MDFLYSKGIFRSLLCIVLSITLLLPLTSCGKAIDESTVYGVYFDTYVSITAYDGTDTSVLNDALTKCAEYELIFSPTLEGSELYKLNHRDGSQNLSDTPGEYRAILSDDLYALIKEALDINALTNGAFSPALGSIKALWDFDSDEPVIPDDKTVSAALAHTDINNIILEDSDQSITLLDDELGIDLGGIAKGYIADCLADYLKDKGVTQAVIRLGGNIYCIGDKYGQDYSVMISKPFGQANESVATLKVSDTSVVTAGVYEQYFEKDGRLYHHITDPSTGYPADSDLTGVTIICPDSSLSDALSTSVLVLGSEEGAKLLDSFDNISAVLVDNDGNVTYLGPLFD